MKASFKTIALVIAVLGIACAGTMPAAAGPLPYSSGIVQSDGTILAGSMFVVAHTGTGRYTVTYDTSTFGSLPAMSVTAFGPNGNKTAIATVYSERSTQSKTTFSILISRTAGKVTPFDSGFQFTIVAT